MRVIAIQVRPWKLFSKLRMFGLFVPWRMSFIAFSTASLPLFTNIALFLTLARRDFHHRLGELYVGLVVDDVDAAVDELASLVADRVDDLLLAVA